ncbi:hypothetical protein [Leifsonia aquatica]|uniref:hypothetical protein n=1 Tax=Leifsonia aquatica TaxID=144185 RepID=UPI00046971CA|nr:hypothetical protein [Leifsonia aquatica]
MEIVLTQFAPEDVAAAIDRLLADPALAPRKLAVAMLVGLRNLEQYAPADALRSLDMILPELGRMGAKPTQAEAKVALRQLVGASGGALTLVGEDRLLFNTSMEELERRTAAWAANNHTLRHGSTFHDSGAPKPEI